VKNGSLTEPANVKLITEKRFLRPTDGEQED